MGIGVRKAMCGKTHRFRTPQGDVFTRSLMVADLSPEDSLTLQQRGVGEGRRMGCGLFVPQKGIKAVKPAADE